MCFQIQSTKVPEANLTWERCRLSHFVNSSDTLQVADWSPTRQQEADNQEALAQPDHSYLCIVAFFLHSFNTDRSLSTFLGVFLAEVNVNQLFVASVWYSATDLARLIMFYHMFVKFCSER